MEPPPTVRQSTRRPPRPPSSCPTKKAMTVAAGISQISSAGTDQTAEQSMIRYEWRNAVL